LAPDIDKIHQEAMVAIDTAASSEELEKTRIEYLGKKGKITNLLKSLGVLPAEQRPLVGKEINALKKDFIQSVERRLNFIQGESLKEKIQAEDLDISLPGRYFSRVGSAHPITLTLERIQSIFRNAGFLPVSGPEIETDYYNFEALNIPAHHPARAMHDTFYVDGGYLLRTHTSPVQIRWMEKTSPPIRVIAPGRVYRCDYDQTHSPMFHQVEGLLLDEGASMSQLKGLLDNFLKSFFQREDIKIRYRPSYFPFTEPSMEVDIQLKSSHGLSDWLEVMGCGMVNPVVLTNVGIDPEEFTGFAFGLGVERLAMLYYGISDLRQFFVNDLEFIGQFGS
tara:strand:+ start:1839 stop:2846 length:1008 start_codon:yes stop_codon:yes gene_type:complete